MKNKNDDRQNEQQKQENMDSIDPILESLNRIYGQNPEISRLPKDIAYAQYLTIKKHSQ